MDRLPSNIMFDIFSRMPAKCLARSRCVSKVWCEYIDDGYLTIIHHERVIEEPTPILYHTRLSHDHRIARSLCFHVIESKHTGTPDHTYVLGLKQGPFLEFLQKKPISESSYVEIEVREKSSFAYQFLLTYQGTNLHHPFEFDLMMEQQQKQISCGSTYDRLPPQTQWAKYPWFVAQMQENQIFYTLHNPQLLYRCQIPELIGTQIRAYFHGWVVLSKHPKWFLWNPLTSNLIRLPPLIHMKHEPDQCCLSAPPDDPTSVFLLSTHGFPILTFCRLDCTRNKLKWAKFPYGKELRRIIGNNGYLHDLTCCNGKVYAFNSDDDNHTVIEIDIAVEGKKIVMRLLSFVEQPGPSFPRFRTTNGRMDYDCYLKGYCSELFYIEIDLEGETRETVCDVHLYKLDMSNMIWEEMEDLKDAIFFLQVDSQYPVYYSPVITTELAGYIHILDRMGKLLYSYHVKNRTISIASMSSLVPTSDMSSWGMLEYRLGGDHANLKQEVDKDDGNIVVKSATISKPPVFDSKKRTRTDESYLLNLPFHILESIMEHCVCVEYMNFRATCKLCHLAAPSVQWSNKTTLKRLQSYSVASPWLMVFDSYQGIITLSDLMMGDKYFIKTPQELMGDIIVHYSRYGWLLIEKGGKPRRMMLFNPFTSDIRELPLEYNFDGCWFSAPPTSKDCMVVRCNLQSHGFSIHFLGQEQFLRRPYLELGGDVPYSFRFPTFHDKHIYALSNDGRLDVIREINEEEYTLETVVAKPPGCVGSSFLVECEQHLLLVIVFTLEESVDLFKLNDFTKEWEKLDGLGKHTIYIADTCFCIEAKTPETENKIYFSGLHNGKIVFYSFETLSYHTSDGENIKGSLRNFLATKFHWHPHTWIEPIVKPYEFKVGATPGRERKRDFVDNPNGLFSAQAAPKPPPAMYSVVEGMKVGGKRRVIVPPEAGYGKKGQNEIPVRHKKIDIP
ncbi:hypothetical protein Tco_1045561 [Tanacetum coccineum]|uniref:peptidylprolyl isomerase n=1 Tax=Tanacetum coccineum TaxID=301880 RepID=A0ABQ5GUB6_9ASTR